jgi:hypothetical protein
MSQEAVDFSNKFSEASKGPLEAEGSSILSLALYAAVHDL